MAKYYYSTQPFLAWCFNHYFYGQKHFAWVGAPFYPYRQANPRSSNPLRIYEDLYEPWKDQDDFSPVIAQKRLSLRNGVIAHAGNLPPGLDHRLKVVCDRIDTVFFYPIVYRVNIDTIDSSRLIVAGSGLVGSREYRIADLSEAEFDLLFIDLETDNVPHSFADLSNGAVSQADVLYILGTWIK